MTKNKKDKNKNTKSILDDDIHAQEKIHAQKVQQTKQNLDVPIAICEWYSYNGRRCRGSRNQDVDFCDYHTVLKNDFQILDKEDDSSCCVKKDIKLIPRNKNHITYVMDNLGYDQPDNVDVCLPGGSVEEGSIIADDYIVLAADDTKYYYESHKGKEKAKTLRILLTDHCDEIGVVSVRDSVYCQDCYIKASKKLGYPSLKLFGYELVD